MLRIIAESPATTAILAAVLYLIGRRLDRGRRENAELRAQIEEKKAEGRRLRASIRAKQRRLDGLRESLDDP